MFRDEGYCGVVSRLPREEGGFGLESSHLGAPCRQWLLQAPLSSWGTFSSPLSFLPGKTLPPAGGGSAWPLCLPLRWRSQLRLSLFQGDHHLAPCSCRAPQAPLDRLGPQAPSAAPARRFSSTSLSTCRVSAGPVGQCVCAHVCMYAWVCAGACTSVLEVSSLYGQAQVFHPCMQDSRSMSCLPASCPHTRPQPHPSRHSHTHTLVHMHTQLHTHFHMC